MIRRYCGAIEIQVSRDAVDRLHTCRLLFRGDAGNAVATLLVDVEHDSDDCTTIATKALEAACADGWPIDNWASIAIVGRVERYDVTRGVQS